MNTHPQSSLLGNINAVIIIENISFHELGFCDKWKLPMDVNVYYSAIEKIGNPVFLDRESYYKGNYYKKRTIIQSKKDSIIIEFSKDICIIMHSFESYKGCADLPLISIFRETLHKSEWTHFVVGYELDLDSNDLKKSLEDLALQGYHPMIISKSRSSQFSFSEVDFENYLDHGNMFETYLECLK